MINISFSEKSFMKQLTRQVFLIKPVYNNNVKMSYKPCLITIGALLELIMASCVSVRKKNVNIYKEVGI